VHEVCILPLRTWPTVPCWDTVAQRFQKHSFTRQPIFQRAPSCACGGTRLSSLRQRDQLQTVIESLACACTLWIIWMLHRQHSRILKIRSRPELANRVRPA